MAVHTASTLEVQYRPHSELEFGVQSETNITSHMSQLVVPILLVALITVASAILVFG